MTVPHKWILAGLLLVAGCSAPEAAAPMPRTTPSTERPTTTTSEVEQSGFCLDLPTFAVALVHYKAAAGKAMDGEPLNFETLKRGAAYVAQLGDPMVPSAPPEIADDFRTVLAAVATSASNLKEGATVLDVVDPLYGKQNRAAFEAVDTFEGCGP